MINFETLCSGCFKDKGNQTICPHCGYDESVKRGPLPLPHRTVLNGQYLIGKILGKPGGFGITYLAWDIRLEVLVAIKEYLPRDLAGRDTGYLTIAAHSAEDADSFRYGLEQFLQEARTLARFDHAHVVRIRNVFEENGTAYLVMDYYHGITLSEYLKQNGKLSEQTALDLLMPILDGLREVHDKGFLHRDVKPQNIYITKQGRPILLDFGAARNAMGERSRSLSVVLTPGYAPFEQYQRKGEQGPWTDIYACAAVLYEMVTGTVPPEAIERSEHDELKSPQQLTPILSPHIAQAIVRGLSVRANIRPQSMREFQEQLSMGDEVNKVKEYDKHLNNHIEAKQEGIDSPDIYVGFWSRLWEWMGSTSTFTIIIFFTFFYKYGYVHAWNLTGTLYEKGYIVTQDYKEAVQWYRKSAERGNSYGQTKLGDMYQNGLGVTQDYSQALQWYRKAAEQGDSSGQNGLGYMYQDGLGVTQDYPAALQWHRKAAEQGNAYGQNSLGSMYQNGLGVPQDYSQALRWYRKAAEQGDADGQNLLGNMYSSGLGVTQDYSQALQWYRKAAEQGDADGQNNLGNMYRLGLGVTQDYSQALQWYRKAAEQGNSDGQYNLGYMYQNGLGVTQDYSQALQWYRKAAEQGDSSGQNNLGRMYDEGWGVPEDNRLAVEWYRKSAEQNNPVGQFDLAMMYESGEGIKKDKHTAILWYRKAAEQGYENAQKALQRLGIK